MMSKLKWGRGFLAAERGALVTSVVQGTCDSRCERDEIGGDWMVRIFFYSESPYLTSCKVFAMVSFVMQKKTASVPSF